jgi:hypothetical protein
MNETVPGLGHNLPPLPRLISEEENLAPKVTEFLGEEFAGLPIEVSALLEKARALPKVIEDDDVMASHAKMIKEFREVTKRIEALHAKEKAPYWTSGQAVDSFFFMLLEKCTKRTKTSKPGAADVLQGRLDVYLEAKRLAREAELRREAQEAERLAREAQAKADREAREAEDARLAAERARKPDAIVAKTAVADARATAATESMNAAGIAMSRAEEAHIATLAKPADMVRQRVDDLTLTMSTKPYAVIEDEALLDRDKLWPFIKFDAKEAALTAWAKTTSHNQQMTGARIGKKAKGQVL